VTQAVAALPPGTAMAVFLAAVERVTAEVEARGAAADVTARTDGSPPPSGEVSPRDLALAAALIAGRLVPDPHDPLAPVAADGDAVLPEPMMRDRLYLLDPVFADPALPGRRFYCRDCVTVDGLLALFPECAAGLEVIRIPYPRPRAEVVAILGEAQQNLPVLVLGSDPAPGLADGRRGETFFVGDFRRLLHALHVRHGFPETHP